MWDKNNYMGELTKQFMGRGFLFAKSDEEWKLKRKACAHAFYKERLEQMVEVLKDIVENRFESWLEKIKASNTKSHTIDVSTEFMDIMSRNIITVAFGEDVNDELMELKVRKSHAGGEFETKKVDLTFAITECWEQVLQCYEMKLMNPLRLLGLVGYDVNFTPYQW